MFQISLGLTASDRCDIINNNNMYLTKDDKPRILSQEMQLTMLMEKDRKKKDIIKTNDRHINNSNL